MRWELNTRGFGHVQIYASGGIDESQMADLNPHLDGYGVGTSITNAKGLDSAMDISRDRRRAHRQAGKGRQQTGAQVLPVFRDAVVPLGQEQVTRECGGDGKTCSRRGTTGAPFCSGPSRLNR